jgi:hypothetical protein
MGATLKCHVIVPPIEISPINGPERPVAWKFDNSMLDAFLLLLHVPLCRRHQYYCVV